jgi:hypothetical protein
MIAVHAVFGLQVADHGLDGGAALHLWRFRRSGTRQ